MTAPRDPIEAPATDEPMTRAGQSLLRGKRVHLRVIKDIELEAYAEGHRDGFRAARDEGRQEAVRLAEWIVQRHVGSVDHACAECVPGGSMVVAGFRCVPHEARAILDIVARHGRSSDPEPAPDGLRTMRDALDEVAEASPVDEISDAPWVVERGSIAWLIREGEKGPQVGNFILEADARWVAATRNAAGAVPALQATGEGEPH